MIQMKEMLEDILLQRITCQKIDSIWWRIYKYFFITIPGDEYICLFYCLEQYMNEVKSGMTSKEDIEPTIVKETEATALVDGNNVIGMI